MKKVKAEYIWLDGNETQELRSKTKILEDDGNLGSLEPRNFPQWGFDGSSTNQAAGEDSDCILAPVYVRKDPLRDNGYLVLCDVRNSDQTPHSTNHRTALEYVSTKYLDKEAWFGIEQEYFMLKDGLALGWPGGDFLPQPQGKYYCSIGSDRAYGREVAEAHLDACLKADIQVCGINAEVAPGQWEFQVGPCSPLEMADSLWLARYLLNRVAEDYGVTIALDPKPYKGSWNGSGAHTNFSTKEMREAGGLNAIKLACTKLAKKHEYHMKNYGAGNQDRMTGEYETSKYDTFSYDVASNRGNSVRIPVATRNAGQGYFEDRRPASNMDPYRVCRVMLETICGE